MNRKKFKVTKFRQITIITVLKNSFTNAKKIYFLSVIKVCFLCNHCLSGPLKIEYQDPILLIDLRPIYRLSNTICTEKQR